VDYVSTFNPEKLTVEYNEGVTATGPAFPRRCTLTHSDVTGKLFLTIGFDYAWEKVNPLRDEVLGEWKQYGGSLYFCTYVSVDQGQYPLSVSAKRNEIFRRELPLALTAIRYGDRLFFNIYPQLNQAPIIITFMSAYSQFAKQENWGSFQNFTR
jgi:hypothetical protein